MSVNRVTLLGYVGKDPEIRYLNESKSVANFSIATTERGYTTANGSVVPDRSEWHRIVVWKKGLVEIVEKYVHKGSKIYIEGKLRSNSYEDKQGIKHHVTDIRVEYLELLDRKPNSEESLFSSTESSADLNPIAAIPEEFATPPLEMEEDNLPNYMKFMLNIKN